MQQVAEIDFSSGPVDLIVRKSGTEWLVRDQELVRNAALIGIPDTSSEETGLLLMSVLFMSPPGTSPASARLTFRRDGETLSSVACMRALCGNLPELRELFDPLIAAGVPIEHQYKYFSDYGAYLKFYESVEKSADRYGPIDPPTPEEKRRLDNTVYVCFPILYQKTPASDWLVPARKAYAEAFLTEYADVEDQIALNLNEERGEGMILRRCSDNGAVMSKDDAAKPIFPSDWEFVAITAKISATSTVADQITDRSDWSFLPEFNNDNEGLTQDIIALVNQHGDQTDPDDCYQVDFAPGSGSVSVWHDYPYSYSLSWTRILPKETP